MIQSVEDISESISETNRVLVENLLNHSSDQKLGETVIENLGHTLFNILLWETRDIYLHTTSLKESEEIDHGESDSQIQRILVLRTALVEILENWMELDGENDRAESRRLQCEAFRIIGDLRKLFPLREESYHIVDKLAWHPSEVISSLFCFLFSTPTGVI
jgi:hypothetical protein